MFCLFSQREWELSYKRVPNCRIQIFFFNSHTTQTSVVTSIFLIRVVYYIKRKRLKQIFQLLDTIQVLLKCNSRGEHKCFAGSCCLLNSVSLQNILLTGIIEIKLTHPGFDYDFNNQVYNWVILTFVIHCHPQRL